MPIYGHVLYRHGSYSQMDSRDAGSGIRDPGSGIRDPGSGIRDPGSGIRETGADRTTPTTLLKKRTTSIVTLMAAAVIVASAQEPRLRIVSPTDSTYLVGSARLHAVIEPSSAERDVERVTFFVGATQVCEVTKPPFECDYDAGESVQQRQIRVVATMQGGNRLVQTVTT